MLFLKRKILLIADTVGTRDPVGETLNSERQRVLRDIYERIGGRQVNDYAISFAPAWVLEEAFQKEYGENWSNAVELFPADQAPLDANIIASHSVHRIKVDGDGNLMLKNRIVSDGNRYSGRDVVRRDFSSAELMIIRILLALATILRFRVWTADVKGAYMQSGDMECLILFLPRPIGKAPVTSFGAYCAFRTESVKPAGSSRAVSSTI